MPEGEWRTRFQVERPDGTPVPGEQTPSARARERAPAGAGHARLHVGGRAAHDAVGHGNAAAGRRGGAARGLHALLGARPGVKATVRGCRGSLAAPGPDTVGYGGNTACLALVLADDTPLILDAGTGIRLLGLELARAFPRPIHILLTHLHLDHLEGLGLFAPIWMPTEGAAHLGAAVAGRQPGRADRPLLLAAALSGAALGGAGGVVCHDLPAEEFRLGSATVLAQPVTHRGPTVGVRVDDADRSLAYIPDHEPYLGLEPEEAEPGWLSGYAPPPRSARSSTTPSTRKPSTASGAASGTRASRTRSLFRAVNASQPHPLPPRPAALGRRARRAGHAGERAWADTRRPPQLARDGMQLDLDAPPSYW